MVANVSVGAVHSGSWHLGTRSQYSKTRLSHALVFIIFWKVDFISTNTHQVCLVPWISRVFAVTLKEAELKREFARKGSTALVESKRRVEMTLSIALAESDGLKSGNQVSAVLVQP
eukprot:gb/GEZN01021783.1/.p2 GENE.gb/GEZN01021783.1/~~gb/GEZN01021783.1/.p2  ORF type:complete len:116 (-),score=7.71 gb/GEZN01021783.1/:215-562(-)